MEGREQSSGRGGSVPVEELPRTVSWSLSLLYSTIPTREVETSLMEDFGGRTRRAQLILHSLGISWLHVFLIMQEA